MVSIVPLYTSAVVPDEPGLIKRPIAPGQFEVFSKLVQNEGNYYNGLELLRRFVLGIGMRVTKMGGAFTISGHVQRAFDTEWMVAFAQMMRCLSSFGVCLIDKNKHDIPIVRDFSQFNCTQLEWRDGSIAWHVVWKPQGGMSNSSDIMGNTAFPRLFQKNAMNNPEEDVLKTGYVLIRSHIDSQGFLCGDARRLLSTAQLQSFAIECVSKAWARQSAPAMVMQQRKRDSHELELDAERGRLGDHEEALEENAMRRNEANVNLVGQNALLVQQINGGGRYRIPSVLVDPYLGLPKLPLDKEGEKHTEGPGAAAEGPGGSAGPAEAAGRHGWRGPPFQKV